MIIQYIHCYTSHFGNSYVYLVNFTTFQKHFPKATYKIPGFGECPKTFTVKFFKGKDIPHAERIYGSKAVGEPPYFLGSSVFFAICDAISAARRDKNKENDFVLTSPATCVKIYSAIHDLEADKSFIYPQD